MKTLNHPIPANESTDPISLARRGKIARLPRDLREELNLRLADGEAAPKILAWLNREPEVREVLAQEFERRPISAQNLSEWRQGGFREWQGHQEACDHLRRLNDRAEALLEMEDGRTGDQMSRVFAVELIATLERSLNEAATTQERWACLREGLREIRMLRRGDHHAARLALAEERWERQKLAEDEARAATQKAEHNQKLLARVFQPALREGKATESGGGEAGHFVAELVDRINNGQSLAGMFAKIPKPAPAQRKRGQGKKARHRPGATANKSAPGTAKAVSETADQPAENGANQTKSNQIKLKKSNPDSPQWQDRPGITRAEALDMAIATGLAVHWRNEETGQIEVVYPPPKTLPVDPSLGGS